MSLVESILTHIKGKAINMGCDGGTIPTRGELVRQKKKAEVKDKNAANMAKWRHCSLKYDPLRQPIVVDSYGLLYNKDAILEYLLDRSQFDHGPSHIKKMRDVKELQLTENPSFKSNHNDLGNEYLDVYSSPFICPLTGVEMNGVYKFCVIWTCGCVLSDRALRSVSDKNGGDKLSCPKCGEEYSSKDDVVILNPDDDDSALMAARRERLATSQKKTGSSKRKSPDTEEATNGKKTKAEHVDNDKTASASSTTTTKASSSKAVSTADKTSIQQDPTTTALYKSLFTTSDAAKKKEKNKAHWVTYNPLYF